MNRKILRVMGIFLIIIILAAFITTLVFYQELRTNLQDEIKLYGPWGLMLGGFIVDTIGGPLGPEIPVATGLLAGIHVADVIFMVMVGSVLASLLIYALGLTLGHYGAEALIGPSKYVHWQAKFSRHGRLALALGALTPVPYVTMCLLGGVFRVKLWEFIVFAIVCRIVRIVGSAYTILLFGKLI